MLSLNEPTYELELHGLNVDVKCKLFVEYSSKM